jgi:hypothetical protein
MNFNKKILATFCLAAIAGVADAGTISITPATSTALQAGGATSPTPHSVAYQQAASGETTANFQGRLIYDSTRLTATIASGAAACTIPSAGTVVVVTQNFSTPLLANGTVCEIAFSSVAAAPLGVTNLDFQFDAMLGDGCLDDAAGAATCSINDATVEIVSQPPVPLTLSYSPAPGALPAFGSGVIGSSASQNIAATAAGNSGTASLACTATAGFTVTPSLNFAAAGSQNIAVGCTYAAAASNGSVTCTEIDGDTPSPGVARTWTATCPAGSVAPVNPTITTVTPTGAFAMPTGTIGQTVTRPIQFTAAGGAGSGSATIACTAPAPVTVVPANQTVTGSAQPQNVVVSLPLTSAAQGPFTVSCVITDSAGARTNTFDVTAAAGSAFVAPSVVPATSTWSMVALIALMAGFGIALVGFRRNH